MRQLAEPITAPAQLNTLPFIDCGVSGAARKLIVNKQIGQWGTEYDAANDLARFHVAAEQLPAPGVEQLELAIDSRGRAHRARHRRPEQGAGIGLPGEAQIGQELEAGEAGLLGLDPRDHRQIEAEDLEGEEGADAALRVPRSMLTRIIQARLEEIFNDVQKRLQASGYDVAAGRRAVLTGGACQLTGTRELAARMSFKSCSVAPL